jgi:sialate O-acetylesterase
LIIQGHGQLRFASYFGDNMVLQGAPQRAIVWGYGAANALTTLSVNKKVYYTISGSEPVNQLGESMWSVTLDPESEEGPFEVIVTQPVPGGSLATISLRNVLYGDVWLCSGQSNMQMAVVDTFNGSVEIANAGNYPKIRLYTGYINTSPTPLEEPSWIVQHWTVASPESVAGIPNVYFSAVCWLYGRRIQAALNGRPIGLLVTAWGGTAIEIWMPPDALKECGIAS